MMASVDKVVRPVGSQAKFNTARNSLGILRAVIVTCRYRVSTAHIRYQSLSLHDAVENALATVILDQAMLRVGIAGEDTKEPVFVGLKTIDMRRMIEWEEVVTPPELSKADEGRKSKEEQQQQQQQQQKEEEEEEEKTTYEDDRLLRSLEKHHEAPWDDLSGKPGWKIVVRHDPRQLSSLRPKDKEEADDALLSFDVSFCFHHAYADGRGGYIFHGALLRALNAAAAAHAHVAELLQGHILQLPASSSSSPVPLPPPMEKLIPFRLSWAFILRTVWAEILYPLLVPASLRRLLRLDPGDADIPWTGMPIDPSNPKMHLRTLVRVDDEARLRRILARCRGHGVSLTGLLHALVARSLVRIVGEGEGKGEGRPLVSATPIALAGYADPVVAGSSFTPGETIHCLVASLACGHDREALRPLRRGLDEHGARRVADDAAVWAFARDMTARLRAKAASLPRDDIVALSGLVGDWHEFFRGKFGKARDASWELSNLGSLGAADAGGSEEGKEKEGGGWFIDGAVFTQGGNPTSAALNVNVAGVAGHGICVTGSWQEGIVDAGLVEAVAGDLRTWITELGDAE
ncbi:hypothetical protein F5Y14DRAFT_405628 [Nemania sp. NC0429]|nr:hypothetical protein F5Y14DRAFT_405628 [Nemania sp. NC0429]